MTGDGIRSNQETNYIYEREKEMAMERDIFPGWGQFISFAATKNPKRN